MRQSHVAQGHGRGEGEQPDPEPSHPQSSIVQRERASGSAIWFVTVLVTRVTKLVISRARVGRHDGAHIEKTRD